MKKLNLTVGQNTMNNELTIQELAAYLPYNLKAEMLDYKIDYVGKQYDEIVGIHQWDKLCLYWSALTVGGSKPNIQRIKPLLLPLSIVTTEFCKIHNIEFTHRFWGDMNFNQGSDKDGCSDYFTFKDTQTLAKYHVDLFNLIPRGLAIDKTTIQ